MKTGIRQPFILPVLLSVLGLIPAYRVTAQTFTNLYNFTPPFAPFPYSDPYTNDDGAFPLGGLVSSGNTLYGTASSGGSASQGTLFAVNLDGTGFTNLHSFTALSNSTNSDGANPQAALILSSNTLYGTAAGGGAFGGGTVFKVNTNGTGFIVLHSFGSGTDGLLPKGGLLLLNTTLYGTTWIAGAAGWGTVFKVNTDGMGFTNLYSFANTGDGAESYAGLVSLGNTLYGTASSTVFKVNTDGSAFAVVHSFAGTADGGAFGGLALSGNNLYGTTGFGGNGTVFKVNINDTNYSVLHRFSGGADGAHPHGDLFLLGSTLYGTAFQGGDSGHGTVFAVNTDGTGFTNLYSFTGGTDGALPVAGLMLSGTNLYGTTQYGGSDANDGTLFGLSVTVSVPVSPPQLTIIRSAANVILTWPTNATGYTLQSTTNLVSPVWTTNSPPPVVVNGQNTVTNPITGTQQFFRLRQ